MSDIFQNIAQGSLIEIFFKIVILIGIILFVIFTLFLLNYVNSLRKIVVIRGLAGSDFIYLIAVGYLIAAVSLFFIALVIL